MITKSSLQRVSRIAGACLLAGSVVACGGDDDGSTPIDAGGGGEPDACVGSGHGSGCISSPFQLPEGGEFRLERFKYDPDNNDDLAAHAFFFSGQTPDFRALAGPAIPIPRADITNQKYACYDMNRGDFFDNGKSPEAQIVVDSREYYDVGGARLVNADNPADVIELVSSNVSTEADDTTDLSASLVHEILFKGSPDTAVGLFSRYEPQIDGSAEYSSLDLKYGQSAAGDEMADSNGNGTPLVYVPSGFTMVDPAEADFYGPKDLIFERGVDKVLRYTINNPEPVGEEGGYPTIIPFIGFVDDNGKVNAYCFKELAGELDDGEFIVPYEVYDFIPAQPTTGYIIFGRFTHVAWEVQREPLTRIDLVGVECLISAQWEVVDAP
jgi:hypothetical protein